MLASLCWGQWPLGMRGGVSEDKRKQTGIVLQKRASRLVLRRDLCNPVSYRALLFLIQGESKGNWVQEEEAGLSALLSSGRVTCPAVTLQVTSVLGECPVQERMWKASAVATPGSFSGCRLLGEIAGPNSGVTCP